MIVIPRAPGKDLEQGAVGLEFGGGVWIAQGLHGGRVEQFGKDIGVGIVNGVGDEVGDEAGRGGGGGVGQVDEGLQGLDGASVGLIHG